MLIWLLACNPDDVVVHNDPPELSIVSITRLNWASAASEETYPT